MPKYSASLIAGLLLCSVVSLPSRAFNSLDEFGDRSLDVHNDWVMYVDVSTLQNNLSYKGSRLSPISDARISYRLTLDKGKPGSGTSLQLYEELWYHNGLPLGLKRYCNLPMISHKLGTIMVSVSGNTSQETQAISSTLARLTLELCLIAAVRSDIVVPQAAFQMVVTDLKRYNFFPKTQISSDHKRMIIHLVSNPRTQSMDKYLVSESPFVVHDNSR